ncbi:DNA primase [Pigmentiphaga sp. NML030171]|uniref:DNA primase n=1 Tax=Pigmentiphaga sp. NML030171 TaxID=2008676 RepID=UPI000B419A7B|nr:DNA primase [Pigmentiphaga sp. NML030171]OVZ60188.1 DNA primase [Pigmentiphaga sp. NML030171]
MIPESFIQDLLARVDIVDVVGQHVQLRKAGANLLGLCPFHGEKSPSFTVSPTKQFYHCFGCGAHGTAIRFLMEHTGAGFPEAVRSLAGMVGMSVPEEERSPRQRAARQQREAMVSRHSQVLETANTWYRQQLRGASAAVAYLKGRGVSGEIAARFGLGWAGGERQGLSAVLPNYDDPLLVEAGLVILSEDGRRYDRFRERVTFPIRNARGHLIGFGGRIIGKGEPKYLNSPETPIFSKGSELYGLWEARQAIRKEGMVVVVEGYMDVVALAQLGIECAVATLGTATTPVHVQKLLRASDSVIFSFDGDKAGRKAAWRALEACLPLLRDDISIRFLFLPDEHDPDSYVREFGAERFRKALHEAMPLSQFMLGELAERHQMDEAEGRARCVHDAKPLLQAMPAGALRMQVQRELAQLTRLTTEELAQLVPLQDVPSGPLVQTPAQMRGTSPVPARSESNNGVQDSADAPDWGPDHEPPDDHFYEPAPDFHDRPAGPATGGGFRPGRFKSGRFRDRDGRYGDERPQGYTGPRAKVIPIAGRLLQLLLTHPGLVRHMDEDAERLLEANQGYESVKALLALVRETGAQHAGALLQAAEGSKLSQTLVMASTATIYEEELPNPDAELHDALRMVALHAAVAEQQQLAASGLKDEQDKARYLALTERILELKKPRVLE